MSGGELGREITGIVTALLIIIILINIYGALVPEAQDAGNELNATGAPLGSLFGGNSVIFIIVMVTLFITSMTLIFQIVRTRK